MRTLFSVYYPFFFSNLINIVNILLKKKKKKIKVSAK